MAKGINVFLAGLFGAAAGAVGGLLLAPKSGKETREQISKMAADLAKSVKTEVKESQARLKDIYGETTEEAKRKYEEVRNTLMGKVALLKTTGKEIDRDKYVKVVDDVVADFKTDMVSTKDGAEKLAKYLKKDWEKVKKALA
ncbi:MAG: YtxH domain-containing protein [Candidatus Shapirobacteria bacterium]|nr:YtxH domain-containing protein [Candidatus Shapirobacteria bacterium]